MTVFRSLASALAGAVAGLSLLCAAPIINAAQSTEGFFTTRDGVRLHYIEAGKGRPLVLIPGWSQTAEQFRAQIDGLSDTYHVIALDMRGHGESDKPAHGYRIHRLSKDVHEFIRARNLNDVTLGGHSMGCSVIWGYWELFGKDRISKLLLIDQMPMITGNPQWDDKTKTDAGAILDKETLWAIPNALAGPDGVKTTEGFIGAMFTKAYPKEQVEWVIQQNLKFPRAYAARLLFDHATNDWRDVLPTINVPTLIVGGKTSLVGWRSQQWMGTQIPGARVEIFEEPEGGNHFMFMENPEKFNRLVREFMG